MEAEQIRSQKHRVLAVDDEPVACQQLAFQIAALGHHISVAASAEEAQEILRDGGSDSFDCLITDCWMLQKTGLDLLLWLRSCDPTLASIVISKAADESLVTQTLRGGASDFLKKPAFGEELRAALHRAVASTQRRRRDAATRLAVKEAGLVQRRMNSLGLPGPGGERSEFPLSLTICDHPYHEAGGDSVALFTLDPGQVLIVVADVSGHGLKSAFISAYFQGLLRGMVECRTPAGEILDRFNRFLVEEWSTTRVGVETLPHEITSLAVCAALIDLNKGAVSLLNSGAPLASRVDRDGRAVRCGESTGPLGWVESNPLTEVSVEVVSSDRLVIWTDGLEDFASQLQICEWSLAYRILLAREQGHSPAWLPAAPDDILLVVLGMEKTAAEWVWFPVLSGSYQKCHVGDIDALQKHWRRSLMFAFPELKPERLAEILLCTREGVLNALLHGCSSPSDCCRLTMACDKGQNELRVGVEDPGAGHNFDYRTRASGDLIEGHRGLLLMHGISRRIEQDPAGARIQMFFLLEQDSKGQ